MNAILTFCAFPARGGWRYALLPCLFASLAVLFWPVDTLTIRVDPSGATNGLSARETLFFAASAPLGQEFSTEYIHSVQLTPVQDIYRIVGGRIWSWQERVQSHNAGLPFARPPFGRFRMEHPWMVVEGGRQSWENIFLRVGNAELGRNVFSYGAETPSTALFEKVPGKRLLLRVERRPSIEFLHTERRR